MTVAEETARPPAVDPPSEAWGAWLTERVEQDIGRPSGMALRAAVDTIAKRLLIEDLSSGLPTQPKEPVTAAAR